MEENTFVGTYLREKNTNLSFSQSVERKVIFDCAEGDAVIIVCGEAEVGALTSPRFGEGLGFNIHQMSPGPRSERS